VRPLRRPNTQIEADSRKIPGSRRKSVLMQFRAATTSPMTRKRSAMTKLFARKFFSRKLRNGGCQSCTFQKVRGRRLPELYFPESSRTKVARVVLSRKLRNEGCQSCTFQKAPERRMPELYFPESSERDSHGVVAADPIELINAWLRTRPRATRGSFSYVFHYTRLATPNSRHRCFFVFFGSLLLPLLFC
jgi:hypothetical protein